MHSKMVLKMQLRAVDNLRKAADNMTFNWLCCSQKNYHEWCG
jgi:hypothetical protein